MSVGAAGAVDTENWFVERSKRNVVQARSFADLLEQSVAPGAFEAEVRNVPGGTGVFLEIGSLQTARQLLEVTTDAVLAPRVTVLRTN